MASDPLESLPEKIARLEALLEALAPAVVAFSGGVDSSLLYCEARRTLGRRATAAIGVSPSLARADLVHARAVARSLAAPLLELATGEMESPEYRANRGDRCYHCKRVLFERIGSEPALAGWRILDGTHADDRLEERPGTRAASSLDVASPLRAAGFRKRDIRGLARARGLECWDRPARPCLASRLRVGTEVTGERLRAIEALEEILERAGFRIYRARSDGRYVTVELGPDEMARLPAVAWREEFCAEAARHGFERVFLDPNGYRGSEGGENNP